MDINPFARQSHSADSVSKDATPSDGGQEALASPSSVERILAESEGNDSWTSEADAKRPFSTLGETLVFKGELSAQEDLLIQGRVEGSIKHGATNLTIGAHGNVKADIAGRRVIVQGKVLGDIRASESVVVEASASVRGDIFAPSIGIREGAKFKGRIDMDGNATRGASEPDDDSDGSRASKKKRRGAR